MPLAVIALRASVEVKNYYVTTGSIVNVIWE